MYCKGDKKHCIWFLYSAWVYTLYQPGIADINLTNLSILWVLRFILKWLLVHICLFISPFRCAQGDVVTHTAWLNRSSILYAGEDKWSVDHRVSLVTLNQEEFTIKIENVDMTDEGQYVCAVQTSSRPRTTSVHLLVQGNTHCYHQTSNPQLLSTLQLHFKVINRVFDWLSEWIYITLLFLFNLLPAMNQCLVVV